MLPLALAPSTALVAADIPATVTQPLPPVRYDPQELAPAKAALARSVAARLVPLGSTVKRIKEDFRIGSLVHEYLMRPVQRFAETRGTKLPEEGVSGPPIVRVSLLAILDPASQSRAAVANAIIGQEAAAAATPKESKLREAIAFAYGQRLSVSELQALDQFLATPEGVAFARISATLDNDLGVFAARQSMDRAIIESIPVMTLSIDRATASLPKVKDWADLTQAEREEAAKLLKLDQTQINR